MRRAAIQVTMLVVVLPLLMAACAGGVPSRRTGEQAQPPVQGMAPKALRVLTQGFSPQLDALVEAYQAKYPGPRIEKVEFPPGSPLVSEAKRLIEEGKVDVVLTPWIPDLARQNLLLPLDPYVQRSEMDLRPYGLVLEELRINGRLYELPYEVDPAVLVYNRDMFRVAGLPEPKENWNWDQFRETARTLTRGDGDGKVWGFSASFPESLVTMAIGQKAGLKPWYYEEAAMMEAMRLFGTMVMSDESTPRVAKRGYGPNAVVVVPIAEDIWKGKAAMAIDTFSRLRPMSERANMQWGLAPVPSFAGGVPSAPAVVHSLAISSTTTQPDVAWQFVRFAAGEEGAAILATAGSIPLYITPEVRRSWFSRQPAPPPGTEVLFSLGWSFPHRMSSGAAEERLVEAAYTAFNQTLSGDRDWEDAFADYRLVLKRAEATGKP